MSFKQFFIEKLSLFFMLTTLITIAIFVIGSAFDAEARFGYEAMLTPLRYAASCVLPTFVTFSRRELKKKELIARMALELVLIEAVMLFFAFTSPVIDTNRISVVLVIAGSVLIIYIIARLFSWLRESAEARVLNEDLRRFRQMHGQK